MGYGFGSVTASSVSASVAAEAATRAAADLLKVDKWAVNDQTDNYTLVLGDASKIVQMNKATANVLTIPTNASVAFAVGTQILVRQLGAGTTTITAAGGVTLDGSVAGSVDIGDQYEQAILTKVATNTWDIGFLVDTATSASLTTTPQTFTGRQRFGTPVKTDTTSEVVVTQSGTSGSSDIALAVRSQYGSTASLLALFNYDDTLPVHKWTPLQSSSSMSDATTGAFTAASWTLNLAPPSTPISTDKYATQFILNTPADATVYSGRLCALYASPSHAGSAAVSGSFLGLLSFPSLAVAASGSIAILASVYARPKNLSTAGGTVTDMRGVWVGMENSASGGVVADAYGVYIDNWIGTAPTGKKWGVYQKDTGMLNLFAGRVIQAVPASAPTDADIAVNQMGAWYDEAGGKIKWRVRKSDGTYQTAELAAA